MAAQHLVQGCSGNYWLNSAGLMPPLRKTSGETCLLGGAETLSAARASFTRTHYGCMYESSESGWCLAKSRRCEGLAYPHPVHWVASSLGGNSQRRSEQEDRRNQNDCPPHNIPPPQGGRGIPWPPGGRGYEGTFGPMRRQLSPLKSGSYFYLFVITFNYFSLFRVRSPDKPGSLKQLFFFFIFKLFFKINKCKRKEQF